MAWILKRGSNYKHVSITDFRESSFIIAREEKEQLYGTQTYPWLHTKRVDMPEL